MWFKILKLGFLVAVIIAYQKNMNILVYELGFGLSLYLIWHTRKVKPLALMFFFFFTFYINQWPYYFEGYDLTGYSQFDTPELCLKATFIQILFLWAILFSLPSFRERIFLKDYLPSRPSDLLYWLSCGFMVFLILFAITGSSALTSGGYGASNDINQLGGMALNEYSIIFIPLMYIFGGYQGYKKVIVFGLVMIYILKSVLYTGGRADTLPIMLMCFLLFFDSPRLKYIHILPPALIIYVIMQLHGYVRHDFSIYLKPNELLFYSKLAINEVGLKALFTQNDIYYASSRIIAFADQHIVTPIQRANSYPLCLMGVFFPSRFIPGYAMPSSYLQDVYPVGGGGNISAFYYFYLGYPGVILVGLFIGRIYYWMIKRNNIFIVLYALVISCTYIRWLGYSHITLIKLSFYILPFYILLNYFAQAIKMNSKKLCVE